MESNNAILLREIHDLKKKVENIETPQSKVVQGQDDGFFSFTPEIRSVRLDLKKKLYVIE